MHWWQGQYRRGLNPASIPFPIGTATALLRNVKSHSIFVTKSKLIVNNAKPAIFDEKTK